MPPAALKTRKRLQWIAVGAGEQRSEGAQHRDEAAEEDDLAAMLLEKILGQPELVAVEPDTAAIALQQRQADFAPDQETDVVADDGAGRGRHDDPDDGQAMRGSRRRWPP